MPADNHMTEIRFEVPFGTLAVIDGYCNGTGKDRTKVIREILEAWSKEKLHVATVICRVAQVNPMASDAPRTAKA